MRKRKLSRERVLKAAVELVDDLGLEALSMRRLGLRLGVEAMSLYRHVADKSALLDGIHEQILGEMVLPELSGSWVEDLRRITRAFRTALLNHPKALPVFATRPAVTRASLGYVELVLGVLIKAGFEPEAALSALHSLVDFVVGHAMAWSYPKRDDSGPVPYHELEPDDLPFLCLVAQVVPEHDQRAEFEFGLETFLLGLRIRRDGQTEAGPRADQLTKAEVAGGMS